MKIVYECVVGLAVCAVVLAVADLLGGSIITRYIPIVRNNQSWPDHVMATCIGILCLVGAFLVGMICWLLGRQVFIAMGW